MILGIESASVQLSIALVAEGRVLASATINRPNAHDAVLAPLIESTLRHAAVRPEDLHAVSVSAGPGSFTGLRIGMATAKGLTLALSCPLIAVPTFDAMARRAARFMAHGADALLVPVFDARGEDVYAAVYRIAGGSAMETLGAQASSISELLPRIPDGALLAGDGATKLLHALGGGARVLDADVFGPHADDVALLGEAMLSRGETADPDQCEPLYLRDFRTTVPKPLAG